MHDITAAAGTALRLVATADAAMLSIVLLSLQVSLSALFIAAAIGLPLGALLAVARFPGRAGVLALLNGADALPVGAASHG